MWYRERNHFTGNMYLIYKVGEKIVIRICEDKNDSKCYSARVYEKFNNGVNMKIQLIQDNSFEVLKFKCLLLAKELGWNVKLLG
tara:strand:- start:173 stop:424 length:252 start_codon:yes stop_codon:yes gene_type:complete